MDVDETTDQFAPEEPGRFYGKYRGLVIDNVDPLTLARIKVSVPAVPGTAEMWALPCVPYADGEGETPVGFHMIPPKGAHVWVEFEGGDPSYPIWTGCYWEPDVFTDPKTINDKEPPRVKIIKTMHSDFILDDTDEGNEGGITLKVDEQAAQTAVLLKFYKQGVLVETGVCSFTMNPVEKKTELKVSESRITMTETAIELKTGKVTIDADETIDIKAGQGITVKAGSNLALQASQGASLKAGTDLGLEGGAGATLKAGTNATIEASANLEAKAGAMGTFKASASGTFDGGGMATIKGGLVKIN